MTAYFMLYYITGLPAVVVVIVLASTNKHANHIYGKDVYGRNTVGHGGDDL